MNSNTYFVNPADTSDHIRYERMSLPQGAILRKFGEHDVLTFDLIVYEIPEQEDGTPASLGAMFVKDHGNTLPLHAYIVGYVEGRTRAHTFLCGQSFLTEEIKEFAWNSLRQKKQERRAELMALKNDELQIILEGHKARKLPGANKGILVDAILKEEKLD